MSSGTHNFDRAAVPGDELPHEGPAKPAGGRSFGPEKDGRDRHGRRPRGADGILIWLMFRNVEPRDTEAAPAGARRP